MAEGNSVSSSQESLILSQGTLQYLDEQFANYGLTSIVDDVIVTDTPIDEASVPTMVNSMDYMLSNANSNHMVTSAGGLNIQRLFPNVEEFNQLSNAVKEVYDPTSIDQQNQMRPPSILPASENWGGNYSFRVSFKPQEPNAKWIFSETSNKLYIAMNAVCPINFSTSCTVPEGAVIRAMALFSSPEHALDIVERCVLHSRNEIDKGIYEARHLISIESNTAQYVVDTCTKRHSVVVPFENPAVGQKFSSYLFKFKCYTSCPGGPNRRALMVVFTLEMNGLVIGRQKINLKVCACPARDFQKEEREKEMPKQNQNEKAIRKTKSLNKPVKRPIDISDMEPTEYPKKFGLSKEEANSDKKEGPWSLKVYDRGMYKFLKGMMKYYMMYALLKNQRPNPKDFKCFIYSSSISDE